MPSHIHLIVSSKTGYNLSATIKDFKSFTSKRIIKNIKYLRKTRRICLLKIFSGRAKELKRNKYYKVWQDGFHPILLDSNFLFDQKLKYIHRNPVKAHFVYEPENYVFSSASAYSGGDKLLELDQFHPFW